MQINGIKLVGFRNYQDTEIQAFDPKINIFYGKNAQGKTNLLEAIYFLATGKSFRDFSDARLIGYDKKQAYLRMNYAQKGVPGKIEAFLLGEGKKSIKINGLNIRKLSELFGNVITVVFAPEDLKTIKESPGLRRRFIDMEISKMQVSYYLTLQKYLQILKNKNKLLKMPKKEEALLTVYNEQMAQEGQKIILKRGQFISQLQQYVQEIHRALTNGAENLELRYKCCVDAAEIQIALFEKWEKNKKKEIEAGTTLYGPHREDMEIYINGKDSKVYASQGQQRTTMFSLKLAVVHMIQKQLGQSPIFLLDDVFSELDEERKKMILRQLGECQVFLTVARDTPLTFQGKQFKIENGTVKPC